MPTEDVKDVLLIANGEEAPLIKQVADSFQYSFVQLSTLDEVIESKLDPTMLIVSEFSGSKEIGVDEQIQISRQQFPNAYLILIVDKELTKEQFKFLSKLGARLVMLKSEVRSAKLSFAMNQILKADYVPFKALDLIPNSILPFSVFHLMPHRRKFLNLFKSGEKICGQRLSRLCQSPEYYLKRQDIMAFKKYIEETADQSPQGITQRCRANFNALQAEFTKMVFELTDQSNRVSFVEGQALLGRCTKLCDDLLTNLAAYPKAWDIINNSSIGEFGSLERAPAVAAYVGMFALHLDAARIPDTMMAALLVDVGLSQLERTSTDKLREGHSLNAEELQRFHQVPNKSLDMALDRKLAIHEKLRSILVATYEHANGKGYPNGINDQKLSIESQIIRLAKEFDARTTLKLGELKRSPAQALDEIGADPKLDGVFSSEFLNLVNTRLRGSDLFTTEPAAFAIAK